jgi:predicted  nucleic acid-binding Zn-ribbon protein
VPPPGRHIHEHDNRPKEPVTFLGVETSEVPRVLSEQLNLPRGFGVVVDYVVPNSPAATAGLQRSDVIRMLNDQIIVSPGQLGVLVRSFAEGTSVTLTVLRKGQEMKLPVKLTKHDVSANRNDSDGDWDWDWDSDGDGKMKFNFQVPDMSAVRESVRAAVEAAKAQASDEADRAREEVRRAGEEARRAGEQARQAARQLRIVTVNSGATKSTKIDLGNATITYSDDKGELKLQKVDGKKVLIAKDAQGKLLFQGPIETEQERAKIPPEVRQRYEKLEDQDLPEIPEAPEPPEPPDNESACLRTPGVEHAALLPQQRTGWRRSTILL